MTDEERTPIPLEIGHVLFIDIVGYSKLMMHEQLELLEQLREIACATATFKAAQSAGKLMRLPTGDGGAFVFRTSPEEPVQCAVEIARELKHPQLRIRMGIHSGPVREVTDLSDHGNIAGAGINLAQRVMDCGDAGHILLSKRVTDDLEQYAQWRPLLHDLGTCEVKHGVVLGLFNLYTDDIGNPAPPRSIQRAAKGGPEPEVVAPAPAKKSIAVLPFENLSDDKGNAYFADGIQEEILTRLSRIRDLKVISRTSTQRFRNTAEPIADIAKQLGVATILEGSVRKAGDKVRVHVQLIDAATDGMAAVIFTGANRNFFGVFIFLKTLVDCSSLLPQYQPRTPPRWLSSLLDRVPATAPRRYLRPVLEIGGRSGSRPARSQRKGACAKLRVGWASGRLTRNALARFRLSVTVVSR